MKMPLFNPNRPPKEWIDECEKRVSHKTKTPGRLCGWIWYHGTSPKRKREILKEYETSSEMRKSRKHNASRKSKPYVGVKNGKYVVFKSLFTPTQKSHGAKFTYVIGPFNTIKGAEYMAMYGRGNPHLQTVADAERYAHKK